MRKFGLLALLVVGLAVASVVGPLPTVEVNVGEQAQQHVTHYGHGAWAESTPPGGAPAGISSLRGTTLSSPGLSGTAWSGLSDKVSLGTSGVPSTVAGPIVQISKTQQILSSACGSNPVDASCNAVISAIVTNTATDQMMPVSLYGNASTAAANDAVGVYSIGTSLSGATGIGTGAYLQGTALAGAAKGLGAEVRSSNNTGGATTYQSAGFSGTGALWLTAAGNANSAEAIGIGGISTIRFGYGLACKNPSVTAGCFRDDSDNTTSITINGTHTSAIALGSTAGLVNLGVQVAEKLRIFDGGGAATSYGFGISAQDFQAFLGGTGNQFSWRGAGYGSAAVMTLSGTGTLSTNGWPVQPNLHPGYIVNNWYSPLGSQFGGTAANGGTGTVHCFPGTISTKLTISQLGAMVGVQQAATNIQLAIYQNGSWGRPGTLIDKTASIATTAAATVSAALGANQQVQPGSYWFCANQDNATATMKTVAGSWADQLGGSSNLGSIVNANFSGVSVAQTYGTWPNFTSGTSWTDDLTTNDTYVAFKVASVP